MDEPLDIAKEIQAAAYWMAGSADGAPPRKTLLPYHAAAELTRLRARVAKLEGDNAGLRRSLREMVSMAEHMRRVTGYGTSGAEREELDDHIERARQALGGTDGRA